MEQEAVGVFTTDRQLIVRSWDQWLTEATGIAESDACGSALADLFPELAQRGYVTRLQRVVETGAVEVLAPAFHHYLLPCPPRQPSIHFTRMQQHVTMSPLRVREQIAGAVVTVADVTPRLERERELANQLRSADEAIRLRAAQTLAAQDAQPAILAEALADTNWRVRRAVASGLARATDAAAVDELVTAIRERHKDPGALNAALAALAQSGQDVVPPLLELLAHEDVDIRTYAALGLGHAGDARAGEPLLRALQDPDANVRYHAIEALASLGVREAAAPLAEIAETRDFFLGFAALDALGRVGDSYIALRLVPLLDDEMLQGAAASALGRSGDEAVAPALAERLNRPGADALAIATALAALHHRLEAAYGAGDLVADATRAIVTPAGASALADAVPHASDAELSAFIVVLGWLDFAGIERLLAPLLEHAGVRRATADTLARRGGASVPVLLEALDSPDNETRKAAMRALGQIGSAEAVPRLIAELGTPSDAAIVAAGALAAVGDRSAFEPLIAQLDHPDAAVRQAMVSALHSIGHPHTLARVGALLEHASPRVREAAVKIAGYFGYTESMDVLLRLCEDEDESVARAAVEHIAYYDDDRTRSAIAQALAAPRASLRAAAARALAHTQTATALPLLRRALADPDLWVRYHAARSVARQGSAELVAELCRLAASDPMPPVRLAAVEALGEIASPDAAQTLSALATAREPELAYAALDALGRIPASAAWPAALEALHSHDVETRLAALDSLARQGDAAAVSHVRKVAEEAEEPEVQQAAIDAIASIGGAEAVEALLAKCADPTTRDAAIAGLARMDGAHMDALADALKRADALLRRDIVEALARRRDEGAPLLLAAALEDADAGVRFAASQALRRLDLRPVERKLSALAQSHRDAAVRDAAQTALAR